MLLPSREQATKHPIQLWLASYSPGVVGNVVYELFTTLSSPFALLRFHQRSTHVPHLPTKRIQDVEVPYWVSSYMQSVNGYLQLDTVTCAQRNIV